MAKIGNSAFSGCSGLNEIIIMNPECDIYDSPSTICSGKKSDSTYYFDGIFYGIPDSSAQIYAEKYGYTFYRMEPDAYGEESRVYRKLLLANEQEKEDRMKRGNEYKAKIVAAAREGIDPVAVCGFSCNHCFLGQWCGGCRSCFNCCSFGTLYEKGKCPNIACAEERQIDGCHMCEELETCQKGFYAEGNDGAGACKAQAMYRKKHGKEKFLKMQDLMHQKYDFEKTQEILGEDVMKAVEFMEHILS